MKRFWDRLNVELLFDKIVAWIPSLGAAIILFVAFWIIFRITRIALARILSRAGFDPSLAAMLLSVYRFVILTLGILMAANQLGINVGAALAGLGIVGLTIGFAARDSLSNIMAGFLIFWDQPFLADEWVTLGDNYGKVAEITLRTTRLLTWNNTWVIIPNQTVINQVVVNHSRSQKTRIEVPITLPMQEDIDALRRNLMEAVREVEDVMKDPPPAIVIKSLNPPNMDIVVHAWVADAAKERPAFFRILEAAKPALMVPA